MKSNKFLVVGYANSIHFWKWCFYLKKSGLLVDILSFSKQDLNYLDYSIFNNYYDLSKYNFFLKFLIGFFKVTFSVYDIINYQYFRLNWIILALFTFKKIVFNCWGSDILITYKETYGIKKLLFDSVLRKSYKIIFDSESVQDVLTAKCLKLNKNNLHLIYFGINTDVFSPPSIEEKKQLRIKYHIDNDSIVLLSIRNLTPLYRIINIIKWFNEKIKSDKIILYIRISEQAENNYINECKSLSSFNKNIIFNDSYIPHEQINELYKISDIDLHFPESDATPVSILEGISCGNLIICSNKIDSYKKLSEKYKMNLDDISLINDLYINDIIKKKKDVISKNRENLKLFHSEQNSIIEIKKIFQI
jgi:hypothetical protein